MPDYDFLADAKGLYCQGEGKPGEAQAAAQISIAISLQRIADALETLSRAVEPFGDQTYLRTHDDI
jgi:hypothetical protein